MLEGIADIEAEAYRLLRTMGASPLTKVTCALGCTCMIGRCIPGAVLLCKPAAASRTGEQ